METIRQTVEVKSDRKLEMNLPDNLNPGLFEVLIVLQPITTANTQTKDSTEKPNLFGFLPQRVDPLEFQEQMRNEWND